MAEQFVWTFKEGNEKDISNNQESKRQQGIYCRDYKKKEASSRAHFLTVVTAIPLSSHAFWGFSL